MSASAVKAGVKLAGIRAELVLAFVVAIKLHPTGDVTITSCMDGKHGRGSKHYVGQALDLRIHNLAPDQRIEWRNSVALSLGVEYDVVLEEDHLHIEFDPKG